mgnify:CR=1 FL=1
MDNLLRLKGRAALSTRRRKALRRVMLDAAAHTDGCLVEKCGKCCIYRWAKESRLRIYKSAKGVARVKRQDLEAFLQKAEVLYEIQRIILHSQASCMRLPGNSHWLQTRYSMFSVPFPENRFRLRRSRKSCMARR